MLRVVEVFFCLGGGMFGVSQWAVVPGGMAVPGAVTPASINSYLSYEYIVADGGGGVHLRLREEVKGYYLLRLQGDLEMGI